MFRFTSTHVQSASGRILFLLLPWGTLQHAYEEKGIPWQSLPVLPLVDGEPFCGPFIDMSWENSFPCCSCSSSSLSTTIFFVAWKTLWSLRLKDQEQKLFPSSKSGPCSRALFSLLGHTLNSPNISAEKPFFTQSFLSFSSSSLSLASSFTLWGNNFTSMVSPTGFPRYCL